MNLSEINFSFGGKHCLRDYGCIYVEDGGHCVTPAMARDTYEIAGMAGSILMGDGLPETMTFGGTLYFLHDPPSQAAAQAQLRRIGAWLTDGRQRLSFDYEPERYYIASVDAATEWHYGEWIGGGLRVQFTAQPYAYAVRETTASATTTTTSARLTLTLDTGEDAPLGLCLENTGTAPITGATFSAHGKIVAFAGVRMGKGERLRIDMEPPIGAVFGSGGNALPTATRFDALCAVRGAQTITAALTYGEGTRSARLTARARGRWR